MQVGHLTVQARSQTGKNSTTKLRTQGKVPGICYGAGQEPVPIELEVEALRKALDPEKGRNTLLRLKVEGTNPLDIPVMLKDTQRDSVRGHITHVDFVRVLTDQAIRVNIPLVLTGKPEGVKSGGTLHQVYRELTVLCKPEQIPNKIEVDVSNLAVGQSIHVSDIQFPEGVTSAELAETTVCVVTAPKAESAIETAPAGETAAAEPAAKSAGGDEKKAEKPKAAAPAKGGK